jgi:hypothetical protein
VSAGAETGAVGATGAETGESGVSAGAETGAAAGTGVETGESGATAAGQETAGEAGAANAGQGVVTLPNTGSGPSTGLGGLGAILALLGLALTKPREIIRKFTR